MKEKILIEHIKEQETDQFFYVTDYIYQYRHHRIRHGLLLRILS